MGLTIKHGKCQRTYLSIHLSADWPIRIFYGLVTAYQGLFGLFVPTSIFHQALDNHTSVFMIIALLLLTGSLLVIDGFMAMLRYCTPLKCEPLLPTMSVFNRWRPWLFLPPAFCYYATLILVHSGDAVISIYYMMLGFAGVIFCLRDGIISQKGKRSTHA